MKTIDIQLFGALRECEPGGILRLQSGAATICELRSDVRDEIGPRWAPGATALLQRSAFASATTVLRDADPLPVDGMLALLPPVSGG